MREGLAALQLDHGIRDHRDVRGLLDHDEYSAEFRRLLCVAQTDGATYSECVTAAGLIRASNGPGWRRTWEELGSLHRRRADEATRSCNYAAAQRSWLHAANYFMAAAIEQCPDGKDQRLGSLARQCLRQFLTNLYPQGQTVTIPWLEGRSLDCFHLPIATRGAGTAPIVVCVAECRRTKEEILSLVLRSARQHGMALLCVDLPPQEDLSAPFRTGPETAIVAIVDYIVDTLRIDPDRIAVISDGSPSSMVARGVALDGRVAAAVCDGGLWELWTERQTSARDGAPGLMLGSPRAPAVHCPMLVPLRASDGIDPSHARRLLAERHPHSRDVLIEVFGDGHGEPWNLAGYDPILLADFVFDWLGQHLDPGPTDNGSISHSSPPL